METRKTSNMSSKLAFWRIPNKHCPEKLHGSVPTHNHGPRSSFHSQSSSSRDNCSILGRVVGNNGFTEPPEMSQISCSQPSTADLHDIPRSRSSQSRCATALAPPPLHQNSSMSSSSSTGIQGSIQQQAPAFRMPRRSKSSNKSILLRHRQQTRPIDSTPQGNLHVAASVGSLSLAKSSSCQHRHAGEQSLLEKKMMPRRIGGASISTHVKSPCRGASFVHARQSSQVSVLIDNRSTGGVTTMNPVPNPVAVDINKLHTELRMYFEKNMKRLEDKNERLEERSKEVERTQMHSMRRCKEQQELIDSKIESFDSKCDSRWKQINQDVAADLTTTVETETKSSIAKIRECSKTEQKALITAGISVKESLTQHCNQYLVKMVEKVYQTVQKKMPWPLSSAPSPSSPITNEPFEKVSSSEVSDDSDGAEVLDVLSTNTTAGNQASPHSHFTRKRKHIATLTIKPKSNKNGTAMSTRRSKRKPKIASRYGDIDEENTTPPSKVARPCVTPSEETPSNRERFAICDSNKAKSSKKQKQKKAISGVKAKSSKKETPKSKKRVVSASGGTKQKNAKNNKVPLEVVVDSSECLSPLGIDSASVIAPAEIKATRISAPRGLSSQRVKRKHTYGRKRPGLNSGLVNTEFSADSFDFAH
eukprot:scaffold23803_cov132-Cylindrotheca_fusiformis.AAC.10